MMSVHTTVPDERGWYYEDENSNIQGPFDTVQMKVWYTQGHLMPGLNVCYGNPEVPHPNTPGRARARALPPRRVESFALFDQRTECELADLRSVTWLICAPVLAHLVHARARILVAIVDLFLACYLPGNTPANQRIVREYGIGWWPLRRYLCAPKC